MIEVKKPDDETREYRLHGWDDEKLYYWTGKGEICISDIPEVMDRLEEICRIYFEKMPQR